MLRTAGYFGGFRVAEYLDLYGKTQKGMRQLIEQEWLDRHEKGWFLYFENAKIAKLEYLYTSQPIHCFKVRFLVSVAEAGKVLLILSDLTREEDTSAYLYNKKSGEKMVDSEFLLNWLPDDDTVTIRDVSEPRFVDTPPQPGMGLWRKIVAFFSGREH